MSHEVATTSVGGNALGLFDLSGNVWEWIWDWYAWDYYSTAETITNPEGPESGTVRNSRGGSWYFASSFARVAGRYDFPVGIRIYVLGFRVVRTVP
jgi:formylglycine-generating enzyme required for sulfatase activity